MKELKSAEFKNESVVKNLLNDIISEMSDEQIAKIIKEIFKLKFDDVERYDEKNKKNKNNYIILTKEIKQKYPRLKNISMIEAVSEKDTWYNSMEYAKNLRKGGYDDWRLPICSGEERVNDSTDEIYALYEAREDLHNLAVEQGVEDDFLDLGWWWSGRDYNASFAWIVGSSGTVANLNKSNGYARRRCVR